MSEFQEGRDYTVGFDGRRRMTTAGMEKKKRLGWDDLSVEEAFARDDAAGGAADRGALSPDEIASFINAENGNGRVTTPDSASRSSQTYSPAEIAAIINAEAAKQS